MQFERQLANISVPEVIRIDTSAIYHKITIQELTELVPQIKWMTYFSELVSPMKINETEAIVSYSMDFFLALGKVLEKTEKRVVRNDAYYMCIIDIIFLSNHNIHKFRLAFVFGLQTL